ncbi:MAG: peroxidase family protein [Planctomycetota bacterium]
MRFKYGFPVVALIGVASVSGAWAVVNQATRDVGRSPVQRLRASSAASASTVQPAASQAQGKSPSASFPLEFRTIEGYDNNSLNPDLGAIDTPFMRLADADYADGVSAPAGSHRPSARAVSNAVSAQVDSIPNEAGASDYLWQWGQFLDHDIDETPIADPAEAFEIEVPTGDPFFDPGATGEVTIALDRSAWGLHGGQREQINLITTYIDASNVYGSEDERAEALRRLDGSGKLKTSRGEFLPLNLEGLPNAPTHRDPSLFLAGDVRANEQAGLIVMHTLFVREHNFWAERLAQLGMVGEDALYETARAIVAAEMQAITYNEFLPVLLGPHALPEYEGYDPAVDPRIANEFATAGYRVGHTMLSSTLRRVGPDGSTIAQGDIRLARAFFSPPVVTSVGLDPYLRGLAAQQAQEIDPFVIDDVRNFLFGPPGSDGFDLVSLNIQRGRDHGLASYADLRRALGLRAPSGFEGVSSDPEVVDRLASVYDSVEDIDAWVGLLSEDHVPGALVGEGLHALLVDQFNRLRDGDRFWYQSYLPPRIAREIDRQTLAVIIRRNSGVGNELPDDVFHVSAE